MTKNIYTIPAGLSFVDALAAGLWEECGKDPLNLSKALVLLPNRRACHTLRDAFLRRTEGRPVLLPRLQPLGDLDVEELAFGFAGLAETEFDLPPAISRIRRQILLGRAIQSAGMLAESFDQAVRLAGELAAFLDDVQTNELSFDGLDTLAGDYAEHWKVTLEFLKILTEHWPGILAENDVMDSAERRNRILTAQRTLWEKAPPDYPVIAVGSTRSIPAARRLLAQIAGFTNGRVILPGLDTVLDEAGWEALEEDHPQHTLKLLLQDMGATREDVDLWPGTDLSFRQNLVTETLRPAATTEVWQTLSFSESAIRGMSRIDCATPQEEAEAIALVLRGVLEEKKKTAALVTPDRDLARRVRESLKRWGIDIDDSAGQNLSETPAGSWLQLVAVCARDACAPVPFLSLLKHPFAAAGMDRPAFLKKLHRLEEKILRGPRPGPGFEGLKVALETAGETDLLPFLERIEAPLAPLVKTLEQSEVFVADILPLHIEAAEGLAATRDCSGGAQIWAKEAGEAAARFLGEVLQYAADIPGFSAAHYPGFFKTLMQGIQVSPAYRRHPRLQILGQVEAQLYTADVMILGGLNEGTWPPESRIDPWLSRPMRRDFGLPPPEKALGQAAHDFAQALAAPQIIMTRAIRVDGKPTVPSRWLVRLDTVLKASGLLPLTEQTSFWRVWAAELDRPETSISVGRPAPRPPRKARPDALSVTQIEKLMRDPYSVYAKKILDLARLDPVDADPDAAERGTLLHAILERFVSKYREDLPGDALNALISCGREMFEEKSIPPEVQAFWWPRFKKMAAEFVEKEAHWRKMAKNVATEIKGETVFDLESGTFTLSAKADRIDILRDGSFAIIDYKTGAPPSGPRVTEGFAPQLPLEAVIAEKGGFPALGKAEVSHLAIWQVSGGNPPVEIQSYKDVEQLVAAAEDGVKSLIQTFRDESTPYFSVPRSDRKPVWNDYEHLARIREWSVAEGDDS